MNDYTEVQIDICAEDICQRLEVDYDVFRQIVANSIEEHFGDRLRTPSFTEDIYD